MFEFLKSQPIVLLFVVVALGYLLGRVQIGGVGLGNSASMLIVGLTFSILGQQANLTLSLPPILSTLFFDLFIFAVGMKVGPQFFWAFDRDGRRYLLLALVTAACSVALACAFARLFHLPQGAAAGIMAGSNTTGAGLGAAQSALASGAVAPRAGTSLEQLHVSLSAAFAIAYCVGLVGYILFAKFLPRWFAVDAARAASDLEAELKVAQPLPLPGTAEALTPDNMRLEVRTFRVNPESKLVGQSVAALYRRLPRARFNGLRRDGQLLEIRPQTVFQAGDVVAISTLVARLLQAPARVGPEVEDVELRAANVETAEIVVSKPEVVGKNLRELAAGPGRGLWANGLFRMGEVEPMHPGTTLKQSDVLRVTGPSNAVDTLADAAGTVVRADLATDVFTLSIGVLVGGLLGAIVIPLWGFQVTLGAAGGLILSGIALGVLRSRNPALGGPFPEPGRKLLEDVGLNVFIAVLGINSGAGVIAAISGRIFLPLVVSAVCVTLLPPLLAWLIGLYGLKMNSAVLLGALAGAHQNSAALQVAREEAKSDVPALGFPVPYVFVTVLFTIFGFLLARV